ncbi:MarR family winged helix-turn-helix transcriptional regulator [uncultured Friedmanniella sp.]|uniref:MarR family winged helix-turn-helix transcriptional regulator n=1 Tax=uncultured Friedmanniella sp. TaxID=335381 RepID=UPI0035CB9F05
MTHGREQQSSRLFGQLVRVVHGISQQGARELRGHGFTPAQYQVLVHLGRSPGCSQRQLSERLGVTKGNVSMLVTRLEDLGLVSRTPDGAAYTVDLTDDGRARLAELQPLQARFLADCFTPLSDDDLAHLSALIAALDPSS